MVTSTSPLFESSATAEMLATRIHPVHCGAESAPAEHPVRKTGMAGGYALQPEPQPPTWSAASPSALSSTWNEWPHPQDETAFGLLIANPAAAIVSSES